MPEPVVFDPRAENCRAVHVAANGMVDGVLLTVLPMPPAKYVCKQVTLIDEAASAGQTTAQIVVVDKLGIPVLGVKVYLAWPWDGVSTTFTDKALPGNTNYPPNHVIINGYIADKVRGPLAIFVGDSAGNINSEVVAGLGLPWNRHVSYSLLFQERTDDGPAQPPPVDPPIPPTDATLLVLKEILTHLDATLTGQDVMATQLAAIGNQLASIRARMDEKFHSTLF